MTLVETVVGMFIFVTVVTTVTAVMVPAMRMFARANELAEINALFDTLSAEILDDASRATHIEEKDGAVFITVNNAAVWEYSVDADTGVLLKGGVALFDARYYKNKTVGVGCAAGDDGQFSITLTISMYGGDLVTARTYAVRPVLMAANQYNGD